jgi:hypothetical protein
MSESSDAVVPDFAAQWIVSVLRPGVGVASFQHHGRNLHHLLGMYGISSVSPYELRRRFLTISFILFFLLFTHDFVFLPFHPVSLY